MEWTWAAATCCSGKPCPGPWAPIRIGRTGWILPTKTWRWSTAPTAASSLEQVLARTAGIGAVKLDSVTTSTKGTDKVTAYLKGNKIRMDVNAGGQPMVLLVFTDNRTQVAYDPTQKSGQMQAIAVGDDTFDKFSFAEIAKTILKEAPAVLGPETIDGRAALLIEGKHEKGNMYRAWIDTEHGLPLRTEDWQVDGKLVTESKNVEFFYLPDSVFEIPAGVKLTTVPASSPKPTTTPTPISAELPVTVPRLYVHPQYHFSIEVPAGWTMRPKDTDNVIFESPDLMMFVQVFGYQKRGNLETFLNSTVAYRVKTQDYQEFSRKEGLLPGSLRAWTLNTQWTNPGSTVLGRKLQVLAVKGDRALELIGGASSANWNKYSAQLEQVAYTLAMAD